LQLPADTDATIKGTPVEGDPDACAEKFVQFP